MKYDSIQITTCVSLFRFSDSTRSVSTHAYDLQCRYSLDLSFSSMNAKNVTVDMQCT